MSHFFVAIIVEPEKVAGILDDHFDEAKIEERCHELLEPYDENTQVEEYEKTCWCVGREAMDAAREEARKVVDFDELRNKFHAEYQPMEIPDGLDKKEEGKLRGEEFDRRDKAWKEFIAEPAKIHDAELVRVSEEHPMFNRPDPTCSDCGGSGISHSTYNPQSKWDWWVVGGRWNGAIRDEERSDDEGGFNFGDEFHNLKENTIRVGDIKDGDPPFAFVTPDGKWHQKAEMGWWAMTSNEKEMEDWQKEWDEMRAAYPDHIAVGVDCHI